MFRYTCFVFLTVVVFDVFAQPEVNIKQGVLRGQFLKTKTGRQFSAFKSIPYAEPPLGELRFKPPVPGKSWSGVKDAVKTHAMCPQRNIYIRSEIVEGEEDCLYLNVYTPEVVKSARYSVMFFIHGGGWLCGTGNDHWYGPDILLDYDVVLVVTNYRLGALGFLSTGDEIVPGNNGLKDQNLALKWVKENIINFGGNPDSITVFGESAGGASTHYHLLSPLSRDLMSAGISQSGTAHVPWGLLTPGEGLTLSQKLAKSLDCPTECPIKMVECLRKVDALTIAAQDKQFMDWDTDPMIPFQPVVEPDLEGAFLPQHPSDIIKSGKAPKVPWMTGVTTEDGALRAPAIMGDPKLLEEFDKDFNRIVPISLYYGKTSADVEYITKKLKKFYFDNKKIDNTSRFDVVDLFTDGWFFYPSVESTLLHLKYSKSPTYYYVFGHHGVASFSQLFGDSVNRYGVSHADELQYLFPVSDFLFPDQPHDVFDQRMSKIVATLWTNFAKYQKPTGELNSLIHAHWDPVKSEEIEYLLISGGVHKAKGVFPERAKLWKSLPLYSKVDQVRDEL